MKRQDKASKKAAMGWFIAALVALAWSSTYWNTNDWRAAANRAPAPRISPGSEVVSIDDAPRAGKRTARAVVIVYSEFVCASCVQFAKVAMPWLRRDYIETGRIELVFKSYPLVQQQAFSLVTSEAALCAHRQGMFWSLHDRLTERGGEHSAETLASDVAAVGLAKPEFDSCMSGAARGAVEADMKSGRDLRVVTSPTVFLGVRQANGRVKISGRLVGTKPEAILRARLEELLVRAQEPDQQKY